MLPIHYRDKIKIPNCHSVHFLLPEYRVLRAHRTMRAVSSVWVSKQRHFFSVLPVLPDKVGGKTWFFLVLRFYSPLP